MTDHKSGDVAADPRHASPKRKSSMSSETTPLLPTGNSHGHPLSSVQKTFCNIVISIVGAGVLGLPYTFKQSGWVAGSVVLALVGSTSFYTMMLLVKSKRKVESEENHEIGSYSELGYVTFGKSGQTFVDVLVVLANAGFCVAYFIFIGENVASVVSSETTSSGPEQGGLRVLGGIGLNWQAKAIYVWLVFPLQAWLASIRSLTRLAPFSLCADIANIAAMAVVMREDLVQIRQEGFRTFDSFTGWSSLPFVAGVAIYAYEGYGLVLPIETQMKNRSKFGVTLASALGCITVLFIIFASLGYFAFGDATQDIITLNLGRSWQTYVIKLALCFGLFFTFPVMMHPVHEVVERRFNGGRPSVFLRTVTVFLIACTAVGVPHFGDFLSLLGNSVCCILSFVLPSLFHLRTHSDLPLWETLVDCALILFGLSFGCWGTWTSLKNW